MANDIINQILGLLQSLKSDTSNLRKDLDDKDAREETDADLSKIFSRMGELKTIMSKVNESEAAQLKSELKQLMSGQEDIFEYNRDVNTILMEVKKRTEQSESTKQKILDNLPPEQQQASVGSLFDNFKNVLKNVQQLIGEPTEKIGK